MRGRDLDIDHSPQYSRPHLTTQASRINRKPASRDDRQASIGRNALGSIPKAHTRTVSRFHAALSGSLDTVRLTMNRPPIKISLAGADRLALLAPVFGRAFVDDPMLRWSLVGTQDPTERFTRCFAHFLEVALDLDLVWEANPAVGAAVWIPPVSAGFGRTTPGTSGVSSNSPMMAARATTRSGTGSTHTVRMNPFGNLIRSRWNHTHRGGGMGGR